MTKNARDKTHRVNLVFSGYELEVMRLIQNVTGASQSEIVRRALTAYAYQHENRFKISKELAALFEDKVALV
jgi:hypothetical protein